MVRKRSQFVVGIGHLTDEEFEEIRSKCERQSREGFVKTMRKKARSAGNDVVD